MDVISKKNTGKLLALKDVFMAGSEKPISDMLLEELITEMATRLEDSSITSLEGLQNAGILNSTNMYVPDNFLLERKKYLSCITNMISLPML